MGKRARALGVVIIGGSGFLGTHLARSLRGKARVVATYMKHAVPLEGVLSLPLDVRDVGGIRKIIYSQSPDAVIYLGGSEDAGWADKNAKLAEKVYSSAPGDVLHAAEIVSSKFLYVSSPSVFDGTKGNYLESDHISPMTLLGKLKAAGEALVRGRSNRASVIRLAPLVGSAHPWRLSLLDQVRYALETGVRIELRDDEYHSWTPVSSAVAAIEAMIERAPANSLYHFGGLTRLTTFEMARVFARSLGYPEKQILETIYPRKKLIHKGMIILPEGDKFDFSLNCTPLIRDLAVPAFPVEETIAREFEF